MSWEQVLAIGREAAELAAAEAAAPPLACPEDGEPLLPDANGAPRCRYCGWPED